jgi:hypothetical protein
MMMKEILLPTLLTYPHLQYPRVFDPESGKEVESMF